MFQHHKPYLQAVLSLFFVFLFAKDLLALNTVRVASGLSRPVYAISPPQDYRRLFICEQYSGKIKILNLLTGTVNPQPFLDISPILVRTNTIEAGLVSICFHPNFSQNGYFYVMFNDTVGVGNWVMSRFQVSAQNPDSAVFASRQNILYIVKPGNAHNGGRMEFNPIDGYMYISVGDGKFDFYDVGNFAQSDSSLLGKILRIDVNSAFPYAIPPDNPFVGAGYPLDEIWFKGFRNPSRWSFDPLNGDMYIGDVGQSAWEEVDYIPHGTPGGWNFGWRCMEGNHCTPRAHPVNCPCNDSTYWNPIYEFPHGGSPVKCAVTGGYVYRGCAIPSIVGVYFFADVCSGQIWSFRVNGGDTTEFQNRTADLVPSSGDSIRFIGSFGKDAYGELYLLDYGYGKIFKVVPDSLPDCNSNGIADSCEILSGYTADCNENWIPDSCDVVVGRSEDENLSGKPDECECIPKQVMNLTTQTEGGLIKLRWNVVSSGNLTEAYSIYQSNYSESVFPGINWTEVIADLPRPVATDSMLYEFAVPADSIPHFYIVTSVCPISDPDPTLMKR